MVSLKGNILKGFDSWGQTQKGQFTYLYNMIFHHNRHDIKQLPMTQSFMEKIGMSDKQILEYVKDKIPPKVSQLLKVDGSDVPIKQQAQLF